MDDLIIRLIEQGGYLGIFMLMVIENVFPPIPSEVIMGVGGIAVARGSMQFWPLLLVGTLGSTLGNYCWFVLGDRLGYRRLEPLFHRWGRRITLSWRDVERSAAFFLRHGHWVVFVLRFSPFLRTMISLPAGLMHMPRWKFLSFTFAGALVWNALLIVGGHWLADYLTAMDGVIGPILIGTVGLAVLAWLWRVVRWQDEG
ncbi:DedA family protein [Novosphingobium sp. B 225]|uniref:DedA family protein n=1 Tax=Novosphingobium sp. B 225 TaxID=1961849 RepID=UPI000B4B941A|nr:DedA family protein [Novosphingobium sp. B 225]